MEVTFAVTGLKDTLNVFEQFREEFGDKNSLSKVLVPSVKAAMQPVLEMSKMLVDVDTGILKDSLAITARRPTNKDRRSNYVSKDDTVIAIVSTKQIPKKLKKEFTQKFYESGANKKLYKQEARKFFAEHDMFYDARAIANEFGTANRHAKPFLRPAMESQMATVTDLLAILLNEKMQQYRAENI